MTPETSIVWFRQDLRLADNPALSAAIESGGPVIPVFIWAPDEEGPFPPGSASRWWLHRSLASLEENLRRLSSRLVIRRGDVSSSLISLAAETGAKSVFFNRRYESPAVKQESKVSSALTSEGLTVKSFNASLLFEPWEVANKAGKPFRVFTAFWKGCLSLHEPPPPLSEPSHISSSHYPTGNKLVLADLELSTKSSAPASLSETWRPGEEEALARLERFIEESLVSYPETRDRPDILGGSRLSPYLHFGEISSRQVWHSVKERSALHAEPQMTKGAEVFLRQLGWREFAHHLVFHFPQTAEQPLRESFADFPWREDSEGLKSWMLGRTGYPIVDAGMRELSATGWIHNRVRMIVASFLAKDLLVPWQAGARWFWEKLVDADLANNTLGWQWTAGCGADAAPFFRIFNPVKQGEKFDPKGDYVRSWVPELDRLPKAWIQKPWEAPARVLEESQIKLGSTYSKPIVNHAQARLRALAALDTITKPGRKRQT